MITWDISGLTEEQYNLLVAARFKPTYQLLAMKYNPEFEPLSEEVADTPDAPFGVSVSPIGIFRAHHGDLYKMDESDGTWDVVDTYAEITDCPPDFFYDDNAEKLYLFLFNKVGTGYDCQLVRYEIVSSLLTTPTVLSSVLHASTYRVSAVSSDRAYVIDKTNLNSNNSRISVVNGGLTTSLEVFWSHPINGFGAADMGEYDSLIMTTPLPSTVSLATEDTKIKLIHYQAGGLICFTVKGTTISDHYNIERFDENNIWIGRYYLNLSKINGVLYATAYGVDGSKSHYVRSVQIYKSADGIHWEQPIHVPTDFFTAGCFVGAKGDYIYLISSRNTYRGLSTDYFGNTADSLIQDISHYIARYSRNFGNTASGSVSPANELSKFQLETMFSEPGVYLLKHYLGYVINGTPIRVLVGTDEVDQLNQSDTVPVKEFRLSYRDKLSWMTDRRPAYEVAEWELGVIGSDDFEDDELTGYGGLRHTKTNEGSWTTKSNQLILLSNEHPASAISTYKTRVWNGFIQAAMKISDDTGENIDAFTPPQGSYTQGEWRTNESGFTVFIWSGSTDQRGDWDNIDSGASWADVANYSAELASASPTPSPVADEYFGLVFKLYDKDNYWAIRYIMTETHKRWEVIQVVGGEVFIHPADEEDIPIGTWIYLRVQIRYNKVLFFRSTDGITWSPFSLFSGLMDFYVIPSASQLTIQQWHIGVPTPVMIEVGGLGYLGSARSSSDAWDISGLNFPTLPPLILPSFDIPPFDFSLPGFSWDSVGYEIDPGDGAAGTIHDPQQPSKGSGTAFAHNGDVLARTDNFSAYSPSWSPVVFGSEFDSDPEEIIRDFVFDPFSQYLLGTGAELGLYLLTSKAVYWCEDVNATPRTWDFFI
ncbi:MAG: hypothetical protein HC892_00210 [Saprospiraceae bacterium]|nr:hypothetical protein [Saprospiraceae bacterium]